MNKLSKLAEKRTVLKCVDIPRLVSQIGFESGKTSFDLAEKAGLGANTAYNWSRGMSAPRLHQFLRFLDAAGYQLVLEKKEGT